MFCGLARGAELFELVSQAVPLLLQRLVFPLELVAQRQLLFQNARVLLRQLLPEQQLLPRDRRANIRLFLVKTTEKKKKKKKLQTQSINHLPHLPFIASDASSKNRSSIFGLFAQSKPNKQSEKQCCLCLSRHTTVETMLQKANGCAKPPKKPQKMTHFYLFFFFSFFVFTFFLHFFIFVFGALSMAFFLPVIMSFVDRLRFSSVQAGSVAAEADESASSWRWWWRRRREHDEHDEHGEHGERDDVRSKRGRKQCCASWPSFFAGLVLRRGAVPRHVGLILDGNRRFAAKRRLARQSLGHALGFDKLHQALEWCFDAGVRAVSVYAFSIDNFRRPAEEVATLMSLAQEKFEYMLSHSDLLRRNQVAIRVWGDVTLLPVTLQALIARVEAETRCNSGPTLNVCFPYTSTHEVVHAARQLHGKHVDLHALEMQLFSRGDHPDLLIRTSGEARLSDFLCWQTGRSHFLVYKCLWPEFSLLHFVAAILMFRFQKLE